MWGIFYIILSFPHNIVMALNNFMWMDERYARIRYFPLQGVCAIEKIVF